MHEITAGHRSLSGTISCVTDRIRFLRVTMTGRFSNFNSISYTENRHELRVTGKKCRLPDSMSGTGEIFISGAAFHLQERKDINSHGRRKLEWNVPKKCRRKKNRQNYYQNKKSKKEEKIKNIIAKIMEENIEVNLSKGKNPKLQLHLPSERTWKCQSGHPRFKIRHTRIHKKTEVESILPPNSQ